MNAQSFVVKGRVFSDGAPLAAANVYFNKTVMGVTTNQKGAFSRGMENREKVVCK